MAISPRAGSARIGRQRKWCSSSSLGGRLEAAHEDALRIDARHDVLDRAVLAGRVERLKQNDQRVFLRRPEHVLRGGQAGDVFEQRLVGFLLVFETVGEIRVVVLEPDLLSGRDEERGVVEMMMVGHGLTRLSSLSRRLEKTPRRPITEYSRSGPRGPSSGFAASHWLECAD